MNELALFSGAGGGILGGQLLGWRTVCAVEFNPYAASVLVARQNDGLLPPFPIWDDVRTFDGRPWNGIVDVVSGGFPCQDISAAGKGAGLNGAKSGLWVEMARIISEVRPAFCFVENSPVLTSRGLGRVLGDMAAMGYDAEWGVLGAADVGAPHQRDRIWIMAHSNRMRKLQPQRGQCNQWGRSCNSGKDLADSYPQGSQGWGTLGEQTKEWQISASFGSNIAGRDQGEWWATEPDVGRVANGVAARVDRLQALGNGQVPRCAAEAWLRLYSRLERARLRP